MFDVPELLLSVLYCLDARSLSSCSQVCSKWHEPSTMLMWAQSTRLEYMVSKLINDDIQSHFRQPLLRYMATKPLLGLAPPIFHDDQDQGPSQDDLDQALDQFRALPVSWTQRLASFKERTRRTTELHLSSKSAFALRVIYILQQCQPTALHGMFPLVTSLRLSPDLCPAVSIQSITSVSSLRHVTFDVNLYHPSLRGWILACEPAINLTSLTINLDFNRGIFAQDAPLSYSYPTRSVLSNFLSSRPWKRIDLSARLVGPTLFTALCHIDTLEDLTLRGHITQRIDDILPQGNAFKSLRTMRLINFLNGEDLFRNITIPHLEDLVLDFSPPPENKNPDCPVSFLNTLSRTCPAVRNVEVCIPFAKKCSSGSVSTVTDTELKALLAWSHLQRLVIRTSPLVSVCITDEFLAKGARSWQDLEVLDIDPAQSKQTLITLQGLAPLARHCLKLHSLRLGLRPKYVNTVLSSELFSPEGSGICALQYLDVGCPSLYGSAAVSTFLSTIFPELRQIASPQPSNFEEFSEGDYFVWTQVVRKVCNRAERDIDGLAQMLRAQDLGEKQVVEKGLCHDDLAQSDCSDDYWAYSGSEDENYSDSEDQSSSDSGSND